jgi:hypothetical protein
MNPSSKYSGQTTAAFRMVGSGTPAAANEVCGSPLMSDFRFFATHPDRPSPIATEALSSRGASTPAPKRQFSVSVAES